MKKNLFGYTLPALEEEMVSFGEKPFRARQLYEWIYVKKVYDFNGMSDLSKSFRDRLIAEYCLTSPRFLKSRMPAMAPSSFFWRMEDGAKVETVLMRYDYGNVICVSSEVGCSMGCAFCASGLLKKNGAYRRRNDGRSHRDESALSQRRRERLPHRRDGDGRAVR
jgi:23S rRNA (adenine2503-C2)-methyltransferase